MNVLERGPLKGHFEGRPIYEWLLVDTGDGPFKAPFLCTKHDMIKRVMTEPPIERPVEGSHGVLIIDEMVYVGK